MLQIVNEKGEYTNVKGLARLYVSGSVPTDRSEALGASKHQIATLKIK